MKKIVRSKNLRIKKRIIFPQKMNQSPELSNSNFATNDSRTFSFEEYQAKPSTNHTEHPIKQRKVSLLQHQMDLPYGTMTKVSTAPYTNSYRNYVSDKKISLSSSNTS